MFCETRKLAQEWTYRYLAAAHRWAEAEPPALARIGALDQDAARASPQPAPTTAEVRACAHANGLTVADRGRLRPEIHQA